MIKVKIGTCRKRAQVTRTCRIYQFYGMKSHSDFTVQSVLDLAQKLERYRVREGSAVAYLGRFISHRDDVLILSCLRPHGNPRESTCRSNRRVSKKTLVPDEIPDRGPKLTETNKLCRTSRMREAAWNRSTSAQEIVWNKQCFSRLSMSFYSLWCP